MIKTLLLCALLSGYVANFGPKKADLPAYDQANWSNVEQYEVGDFLAPQPDGNQKGMVSSTEDGLRIQGAATYKMPFAFQAGIDSKIKLKFQVNAVNPGESVYAIFHANPMDVPNTTSNTIPGLYVRLSDFGGTQYKLDAFYTDGINYSTEMIGGTRTYSGSLQGDHTIQFETSLVQGYTDGVRLFYKGFHFGDWLGYSLVKSQKITNDNHELFVTLAGTDLTVTNIVPRDLTPAVITYEEPSDPIGYAGEEYSFGAISIQDEIDGEVPATYRLKDEKGLDVSDKLKVGPDGRLTFKPMVAGEYTLQVLASDYSNNVASKKIYVTIQNRPHYPMFDKVKWNEAARRGEKYYFPLVRAEDYTEDDKPKDNDIEYIYSGYFYGDAGNKVDLVLSEDENGHYFLPKDNDVYLTDGVGEYFLLIEARNSYGSTFLEKTVWVKYDNVGDDALKHESLHNKMNWARSPLMSVDEQEIVIAGSTYYKGGLKLEDGVRISLSILQLGDKAKENCWFSLSLLTHPGHAKYGDLTPGMHIMFFYENGSFRYNIQYVMKDGSFLDVANNNPLYTEIPETLSIEIDPFDTSLDPLLDDNITFSFDGTQIESAEVYKILRSDIADNEGFVYLACGYYNDAQTGNDVATTNNPKYRLNRIAKTDRIAPEIVLPETPFPNAGKVGEALVLPELAASDGQDGKVACRLERVEDPTGRGVTVINRVFVPQIAGTYIAVYRASDAMGNVAEERFEIVVEGSSNSMGLILGLSIGLGVPALAGAAIGGYFLVKRKKAKRS